MAMDLSRALAEAQRRARHSDHSVHQLFSVMDYVTRWRECPGLCDVSRNDCREPMDADWLARKRHLWTY